MKRTILAAALLASAAMICPASAALLDGTETFTSDHCDPLCGPQPTGFATITGTQLGANTVQFTITPLNGNGLVGGLNGLTTFTFNSTGNQDITFDFGALASLFDVSNSGTTTAPAGDIHQDGFGTFEYGFNYIGGNGASNPFTGALTFTLTGTGLTLASFNELSTGGNPNAFFALDIISGQGNVGQTGLVDCCSSVPVPGPIVGAGIPGLVAALGGMFGLNFYRRRRNNSHLPA
jgi:hypothetical protein